MICAVFCGVDCGFGLPYEVLCCELVLGRVFCFCFIDSGLGLLGSLGLFGFGLLIGLLVIYLCLLWNWFIWACRWA